MTDYITTLNDACRREGIAIPEYSTESYGRRGQIYRTDVRIRSIHQVAGVYLSPMRHVSMKFAAKDLLEKLQYFENNKINIPTEAVSDLVAIDCEMVDSGIYVRNDMLARVSMVDCVGQVIYDSYVAPTAKVTDYRSDRSGIEPHHLENAPSLQEVQEKVKSIVNGKIIVGHSLENDLGLLGLSNHSRSKIRDTSELYSSPIPGRSRASLKSLAKHYLNIDIQTGTHDSIEDARVTMKLYRLKVGY